MQSNLRTRHTSCRTGRSCHDSACLRRALPCMRAAHARTSIHAHARAHTHTHTSARIRTVHECLSTTVHKTRVVIGPSTRAAWRCMHGTISTSTSTSSRASTARGGQGGKVNPTSTVRQSTAICTGIRSLCMYRGYQRKGACAFSLSCPCHLLPSTAVSPHCSNHEATRQTFALLSSCA